MSETWLNAAMTDSLLDPKSQFHVYRRDRSDGYGGVCILVNKLLTSAAVNITHNIYPNVELVGCFIVINDVKNLYLGYCCYCPPNISSEDHLHSRSHKIFTQDLTFTLDCFKAVVESSNVFLIGDFNMPDITWENQLALSAGPGKSSNFQVFCQDLGLMQIVDLPTRGANLLDLVLTNDPLRVSCVTLLPPLASSDHDAIHISLLIPINTMPNCPVSLIGR